MTKEIFSIRRILPTAFAVLVWLFASTLSHAQSREYVVFSIKGSFSGLALGQILKEGDRIEIPANVEVKLLGKDGKILRITGPAASTVINEANNERGEEALTKVSKNLFNDKRFVSILGGTRALESGTNIEALFPNGIKREAWSPELSQFNDYCLKLGDPILRRRARGQAIKVTLNHGAGGEREITWASDSVALNLKEHLQSSQTGMSLKISARPNLITIHVTNSQDTTVVEQAAWLAENKCHHQALQLLAGQ